jgi:hypothetical protein
MEIRSVDGGGFGEDGNEAKCTSLGFCVCFFHLGSTRKH